MPKLTTITKIDRPREKLIKYGVNKLSNAELLAILLRTGTKNLNAIELARKIFQQYPKQSLAKATINDLTKIHGLGVAKACEIMACIELGQRLLKDKKAVLILSPKQVWRELKDICENKKEHFVVFFLNVRNQEIKREIISVGILNASLIHPREVFESAILHSAAHIIVAHNHPSGNPEPSADDRKITKRLVEAGKLLGIEVLDHVIVTRDKYYSLQENGSI
jgi:DNA repair protein RadC